VIGHPISANIICYQTTGSKTQRRRCTLCNVDILRYKYWWAAPWYIAVAFTQLEIKCTGRLPHDPKQRARNNLPTYLNTLYKTSMEFMHVPMSLAVFTWFKRTRWHLALQYALHNRSARWPEIGYASSKYSQPWRVLGHDTTGNYLHPAEEEVGQSDPPDRQPYLRSEDSERASRRYGKRLPWCTLLRRN